MSEWTMCQHVSAALQEELIRHGKLLFFLQEGTTNMAHVCIDERDGRLYVAVFKKSPYYDTRDFNAPDFVATRYDQLPALIKQALGDKRGSEAEYYVGMNRENWVEYLKPPR